MLIAGIDYSITSPAVFVGSVDNSFEGGKAFALSSVKKRQGKWGNIMIEPYPDWETEFDRYDTLSDWAINATHALGEPAMIVVEGYSYSSKGKVFNLAENTGVLKYRLWKMGFHIENPAPQQVKKMVTGIGTADKFAMCNALHDQEGFDIRALFGDEGKKKIAAPISDLVDAYYMFRYGVSIHQPQTSSTK